MRRHWHLPLVRALIIIIAALAPASCAHRPEAVESATDDAGAGNAKSAGGDDPATKRRHAGRLLDAADRCAADIQESYPRPKQCWVRIAWEGDRRVPYLDAKKMGEELNAEALADAITAVAAQPGALEGCNTYIEAIGRVLDIPYFRDTHPATAKELPADLMNDFLIKAVQNPYSGWRQIGRGIKPGQWEKAQSEANSGRIVIGSSHSIPGVGPKNRPPCDPQEPTTCHGHIALVAPEALERQDNPAFVNGPWIRDATLGPGDNVTASVRASKSFGSSVTAPIWVEYVGKDWLLTPPDKSAPNAGGRADLPEPTPECVWCPGDYHCVHNPEGCEPNTPEQPKPSEPQPSEPKPSEPQPSEPKPSEPKPSEPKPSEPEDPEEPA